MCLCVILIDQGEGRFEAINLGAPTYRLIVCGGGGLVCIITTHWSLRVWVCVSILMDLEQYKKGIWRVGKSTCRRGRSGGVGV